MISIGQTHEIEVLRIESCGAFLDAGDLGDVLLPNKYTPDELKEGDLIEVFLYFDSEDRQVATTQEPLAKVGEFAFLKVVDTSRSGAFADWGLDKDLLIPFSEQHKPMDIGRSYLVYLYIDEKDGRIAASSKIDKFIDEEEPHEYQAKQQVDLIIANSTDLGWKAIINHTHWGVLYENEVFQRISFGQNIKGFIKNVRPDRKIDLVLQAGPWTRDKNSRIIEDYLKKHNGFVMVHDKSDPQLISGLFGISKSAFKKAIGGLYKQKKINIEKNGIRLLPPTEADLK